MQSTICNLQFTMDDRYTIDTPENIEFAYDIAGIGSRFLAAIIDTLLIGLAEVVVILIVSLTVSAIGLRTNAPVACWLRWAHCWHSRFSGATTSPSSYCG